ncbi:hypothetical protein JOF35_005541 [Streptomyces demainii]|uniref:ATP-grasp-modified RiPP n=1 Tax=Streptomyces demainii TaxID=588122 RepID=A0ABT9KXM8_9ACTN|nr:hypothetical protein [Streptomyces demainii]
MNSATVDKYETRVPDAEGWHGIPFRHPRDLATVQADGGKHDGGPMPPEAPREPTPQGGDGK